ncbi:hypothetical protein A6M21_01855 [Desulfotomaculum copahuensis]|uniref:Uncharacterized protein n=1 Tax=Desulfotomaculum copahuensis TaxID=1838280 RepID=A0A1B7LKG5_9FIRM|nr:hypothetical protein A6M21_01855 [Desulfotomaculum copahuensis]
MPFIFRHRKTIFLSHADDAAAGLPPVRAILPLLRPVHPALPVVDMLNGTPSRRISCRPVAPARMAPSPAQTGHAHPA